MPTMDIKQIISHLNEHTAYFKWNEGFKKYFFPKTGKGRILLYVDDNIVKEVGNSCGIVLDEGDTYRAHLERTVINYCTAYNKNRDILKAAYNLIYNIPYAVSENGNIVFKGGRIYIYELPYLAVIVYILLNVDNGETQQWDNVHNALGLRGSSGLSHNMILPIWKDMGSPAKFRV